jgi:hypothetical protein
MGIILDIIEVEAVVAVYRPGRQFRLSEFGRMSGVFRIVKLEEDASISHCSRG